MSGWTDDWGVILAQAQLLDSLFGTERGLSASSEVRAEINELITQLEAKNPNPSLQEVSSCTASGLLCRSIFTPDLMHCPPFPSM
jgi:hypothetical protein